MIKLWDLLFRERFRGLWERIFATLPAPKSAPIEVSPPPKTVIGYADQTPVADPRKPVPIGSIDLEPTGYIGQEEPSSPEDVDAPEPSYIPTEDELDIPPPDNNAISSGLTFEELSNATDVLSENTADPDRRTKAAKTLYDIRNTEIMEFMLREVCSADAIENLFKECLNGDGFSR